MARNVTVCIPWRSQPSRVAPYQRVRRFWEQTGLRIIEADSDPAVRFNAAQARNNAVRQVSDGLVILADADSIPDVENLYEAIMTVEEEVIWPYTQHRYIPNDWEGDPFEAPVDQLAGMPQQESDGYRCWTGSCWITSVESYWHVGGFDERFTSWGDEDTCFRIAANTLVGVSRLPGMCVSYNHECPGRKAEGGPGTDLLARYRKADLHPLAMLALTRDPDRFLAAQ